MSKKQEDIIEYARPNNKRTTDPNTLVLGGETPANQDLPPNNAFNWRDHKHFIVVQHRCLERRRRQRLHPSGRHMGRRQ